MAAVGADVTDDALKRLHDAGVRGIRVNLVDKGGMPFDSFADVARFAARIVPIGCVITSYSIHYTKLYEVIGLLRDRGEMAILLVEQYFEFARDLADAFAVMERGEIVLSGTREGMVEQDVRRYLTV